jgi:predicted NACHT family NTPase
VPLRIDLRDYGTWLDGSDPFDQSSSTANSTPKLRRSGAVEKLLADFLAALTASDSVDASTVDDLLDRFPMLIVFDGLDEVAQRQTRQRVVTEIEKFIGRWRGSAVPPKIVVTTRPNVSDLPEPSAQWFETITLMKLDRELRTSYLRKWCAARGIVNRDKRELMRSFDSRTAEPHIAPLAENPMQLTILLYLLHLQGHSVPDKRTQLYDDYMKTFLNREARRAPRCGTTARTLRR